MEVNKDDDEEQEVEGDEIRYVRCMVYWVLICNFKLLIFNCSMQPIRSLFYNFNIFRVFDCKVIKPVIIDSLNIIIKEAW